MDSDPRPTFEQVRVPTLSFYGELDSWAPVEASVRAGRGGGGGGVGRRGVPGAAGVGGGGEAGGDGVELVGTPGGEHALTLPDGTYAPEYDRRLVDWLSGL